jgi:hypothetical protein
MVRRGRARADNSRLSILKSVPSSVRQGRERRGWAGSGTERCGTELEIVDRVLATVPLRVLWHDEERHGKVRSGGDRQGLM